MAGFDVTFIDILYCISRDLCILPTPYGCLVSDLKSLQPFFCLGYVATTHTGLYSTG
jgi:hypothetical protein